MKRTYGKTKSRPRRRKINIFTEMHGIKEWCVNQRWAPSLSQALKEYAKERNMKGASVVGNVMIHDGRTYIAKEVPR